MLSAVAAAAVAVGCGAVRLSATAPVEETRLEAPPTAAQAKAIGARWRADRSAALGLQYANALLSAGLYDALLTEISAHGLFRDDKAAGALYSAEAALRQGRYDTALASASDGAVDPYLALSRARAAYALTADASATDADLKEALRGPDALASEAWLFRARLALDANDFDGAAAAARRAVEAGANPLRAALVDTESQIRRGDFAGAAQALQGREGGAKNRREPAELLRLRAIVLLKSGDARSASRLLDAGSQTGDARGALLTALAKSLGGETAQAYGLVAGVLARAPDDWVARDLAAAFARDIGRANEANEHLEKLASRRPALAALRRLRASGDYDAATTAMLALDDAAATGAVGALLGAGVVNRTLADPSSDEQIAAALGAAINAGDETAMRRGAREASRTTSPLALALAGEAYARLGESDRAEEAFVRASTLAPRYFAPVKGRVAIDAGAGRIVAALDLARAFERRNGGHIGARLTIAVLEARIGAARAAFASFAALPQEAIFADETTSLVYAEAAIAVGGDAPQSVAAAARLAASNLVAGKVEERLGADEAAARSYRAALIEAPESAEAARRYEAAMSRLGRGEEARALLEIAARQRPDGNSASLSGETAAETAGP
jgi:Tfp pilus assembly protein PilF